LGHELPIARVADPESHPAMGEDGPAMSSLITRPTPGSTRPPEADPGRPLAVTAAVAGVGAALVGLVVCMSVALTGWVLADAGAHGDTTDALRVGVVAWLAGHGAHLVASGTPIGLTPLALTAVLLLTAFRAGRWAVRSSGRPSEDRALAAGVAAFTCAYLVVAVVVGVLASRTAASPGLGRTVLGALLVAVLSGGCGFAAGSGRVGDWWARVPDWVADVVVGGVTGVLCLVAAGAALAAVSLLVSFNEAATVMSGLHLGIGDALSYTVVMALFAPNAVLLGVSYLTGPGFAFGVGTTVSPTAVSLGVVPAIPLLAALPGEGPTPGWLRVVLAVPVLAAAVGAGASLHRRPVLAHDLAALRGAGSGFLAGLLVTVLVALAGGPLGDGRLADVGAPVGEVLVFATGLMGLGGLVGAAGLNAWRRRVRGEEVEVAEPPAPGPEDGHEDGTEPTVEVLR
jgi:hypothetical protein